MAEATNTSTLRLKYWECTIRVTTIPIKAIIVTTHLCQMMRSLKKKIPRIKTKMGIVNVITVPVVIGAIVTPYVQPAIPRNNKTPRMQ